MTPQEKAIQEEAIELIDQYRLILIQSETDAGEEILCTTIAKQCALIAVNEIINSEKFIWGGYNGDEYRRYFQEVKIEIEKL